MLPNAVEKLWKICHLPGICFCGEDQASGKACFVQGRVESIAKGSACAGGYSDEGASDDIPIPSGLTGIGWGQTLCQLPRVASSTKWKNKSYDELMDLSKEDQELTKYLSFLYQKFLGQYLDGSGKSQAPDFAGYMAFAGFEPNGKSKDSGFRRVLKK